MAKKELTARQNDVFGCLMHFINHDDTIPTYAELGERLGMWPNGVRDHMKAIAKKGYVELGTLKARSIKVL